jgi:uncharacterized membrane protein required for colicin V production
MGLDITLGAIIVLAAIRGWFKGFVYQAIRITGLVACVFLGDPVRRQVRPHVAPHFTSIQPEMLDRILWWLSCGVSYIVLVGTVSLLIAIARRPAEEGATAAALPIPNDRLGGFLLGAAKGFLAAIFMTAGIQSYALSRISAVPWADEQVKGSKALAWNETYQPAPLIWQSAPVQQFVSHVQRMGMSGTMGTAETSTQEKPGASEKPPTTGQVAERTTQQSETRRPRLSVPATRSGTPETSSSLNSRIEATIDGIQARIDRQAQSKAAP